MIECICGNEGGGNVNGKIKIIVVHTNDKNRNRVNKILRDKTVQKRLSILDVSAMNKMLDIKHTRVPKLKSSMHLCGSMTSAIQYLQHHPYFKNDNNQSLVYMYKDGRWDLKFSRLNTLDKH